jgi:hypothetical protein
MAYSVSESYKETIYSGGATHKAILKINGIEIPNSQIERIEISDPLIDIQQKIFYLGQFASKQIIIKFKNTEGIPIEGNVELSIATLVNNEWEEVPIGQFLIETNTEDYYTNNKLTCLDYAVKMKTNCDFSNLIVAEDRTITPVSLETLLQWICNHYEVELGSYPETNKDYLISTYDNTLSGKYYISLIAELMASNAHFGRDGKLYIIPAKQTPIERINALKSESFTTTSSYTISKVIYDDGTRKVELGNDDEDTLFIRSENMFVLDEHETLINNIYEAVNGLKIDSLKIENYGDVSLDCWDLITYELDGEEYTTINNNKIVYQQTIMGTIDVSIPTETQVSTTNIYDADDKTKIRRLQTQINQVDAALKIVAEETSETSSQVSILELSIGNIKTTVSNSKTEILEELDKYATNETTKTIQTSVTQLQTDTYTKTEINTKLTDGSVTKVKTTSGTFDEDGMHYEKTDAPTSSTINEKGVEVEDSSKNDLLYAGYVDEEKTTQNTRLKDFEGQSVVYTQNAIVDNYFVMGTHTRMEDYEDGTGIFYIGG